MKKIDFSKLSIQYDIEGEKKLVDASKEIGTILYRSFNIELSEFGKVIYYSNDEIEIPEILQQEIITQILSSDLIAPVKMAIYEILNK